MAIEKLTRPVFRAPTKGRCYFTARAAAYAEARALLARKYPTERAYFEDGYPVDPGWHWSPDERLQSVYKRLARRLLRALKTTHPGASNG